MAVVEAVAITRLPETSIVSTILSSEYFRMMILPVFLLTVLLKVSRRSALGLTNVAPFTGDNVVSAGTSAVTMEIFCATTVGMSPSAPNSTTYPDKLLLVQFRSFHLVEVI